MADSDSLEGEIALIKGPCDAEARSEALGENGDAGLFGIQGLHNVVLRTRLAHLVGGDVESLAGLGSEQGAI